MTAISRLTEYYERVRIFAPNHAFVLHIRNGKPGIMRDTWPEMWQSIYAKNNFTLCDPALIWGLRNDGVVDFRDLSNVDYSAVIARMRAFGLKFGFVVATGENGARSVGCFARTDRAFTDEEKQTGLRFLLEIHSLAARQCDTLTPAQIEALMLVAGGARHASAAHTLGITESALKARLKSARHNLGARTTTEAVQLVHALGCV